MKNKKAFDAEVFFAALADKTRLRLLNLMRGGEVCVCFFAETLETNNPKISRHLSYLNRASLVNRRRDGKWVYYRINEPTDKNAADIFAATLKMFEKDSQMNADRKRLIDVCCPPNDFVTILGRAAKK